MTLYRVVEVTIPGKELFEAKFHTWGYDVIEGDNNVQYSVAVIEKLDGTVLITYPSWIKFIGFINE